MASYRIQSVQATNRTESVTCSICTAKPTHGAELDKITDCKDFAKLSICTEYALHSVAGRNTQRRDRGLLLDLSKLLVKHIANRNVPATNEC